MSVGPLNAQVLHLEPSYTAMDKPNPNTVPKLEHLSVPISDIRLNDLCSKSGQPNSPKSGQTNVGPF